MVEQPALRLFDPGADVVTGRDPVKIEQRRVPFLGERLLDDFTRKGIAPGSCRLAGGGRRNAWGRLVARRQSSPARFQAGRVVGERAEQLSQRLALVFV